MSGLHAIPPTWKWATLQDVAEVITGNTPPTSNLENYGGSIPFFKPPQLNDISITEAPETLSEKGLGKARLLPPKSVLVSCIGILGKTAITKTFSATNQQINAIVFESLLQPEYGFYYTQTLAPWLKEHSSATTVAIISKGKFVVAPFPLPPAPEQIRIVEKIEELLSDLDAGVAELKAAQAKLVRYRQSLLKAAVEGALTAEWRQHNAPEETGAQLLQRILTERRARWEAKQLAKFAEQGKAPPNDWQKKYPEPVQPDTRDLPELPEGWVWASADQLTEFITSGSRGWADYYSAHGAIFIRSQNINKDRLDLSDTAFVTPPRNNDGIRASVQKHDLLLTITGANVGKTACVEITLNEAYVSQHVALIRLVEATLDNFIHLYLTSSSGGRGQLDKEAYGAGKPGLNLQQVGSVHIPLPGRAEISALMDILKTQLEAISEQKQTIDRLLKKSTAQRKNILRAAFSGQLVPQDPNDEPASVLLARIRAQREADTGTSARKRGRKAKVSA